MKKNITRRLMTALLAAVMCVSMAACGSWVWVWRIA